MSSVGGGGPFFSLPVMAALLWASLDPAWMGGYTRVGGLRGSGSVWHLWEFSGQRLGGERSGLAVPFWDGRELALCLHPAEVSRP